MSVGRLKMATSDQQKSDKIIDTKRNVEDFMSNFTFCIVPVDGLALHGAGTAAKTALH